MYRKPVVLWTLSILFTGMLIAQIPPHPGDWLFLPILTGIS